MLGYNGVGGWSIEDTWDNRGQSGVEWHLRWQGPGLNSSGGHFGAIVEHFGGGSWVGMQEAWPHGQAGEYNCALPELGT